MVVVVGGRYYNNMIIFLLLLFAHRPEPHILIFRRLINISGEPSLSPTTTEEGSGGGARDYYDFDADDGDARNDDESSFEEV